jgi:transposase-like protein
MIIGGGSTMTKRRTFTREFKLAAVKKVTDQGMSYAEVSRDLDIYDHQLRKWKKQCEASGELDTHAPNTVAAELKRLRDENRQLKMERDILKKGVSGLLMLLFRAFGDVFPRDGVDLHGLLDQAVKQFAPSFGCTAVETERELVEVVVQMFFTHQCFSPTIA